MPNPLVPAASEVVPVAPETSFFDPAAATDIMFRYAMSGQARAFDEGAAKSVFDLNRAGFGLEEQARHREIWDREDEQYVQKKEFETVRGQFLEELAAIPFDDPDFDGRISQLMTDPAAAEDPAVKSLLNYKLGRRGQLEDLALEDKRYNDRLLKDLSATFGRAGFGPEAIAPFVREDGTVDYESAVMAVGKAAYERELSTDRGEKMIARLQDTYGKEDAAVIDARYADDLDPVAADRLDAFKTAAAQQDFVVPDDEALAALVAQAPSLTREAFAGAALKLAGGKVEYDEKTGIPIESDTATADRRRLAIKAAESLWNVAHRRAHLPPRKQAEVPKKAAESSAAETARAWLNQNKN